MDRQTVFTKTAKGLMEATGKTSVLSRDMRALLKEIDGKVTVGDVQTKLAKVPEAKLQQALQVLVKNDFIREFKQPQTAASPQKPVPQKPAEVEMDLDFTMAIPTLPASAKKAEEEALQKAQAEADTRAKAEAEARSKAAAAATAARARAEAEARTKAEAPEKAKASARTGKAAGEAEGEALEVFFEKREGQEAEEQARREAEDQARREAEERAVAQEQERIEAEARARKEAEEAERKAREEAERKAKEQAERERKEAEEKARREADALRAKLEEERKAREEAERKAQEQAERKAKEDAEREAKEQAERVARETEERARKEAEDRAKAEAERKDKERAERVGREAEERTREEAKDRARREAEATARKEAEERSRREAEDQAQREAEATTKREAEEKARKDAEEKARREEAEQARPQAPVESGPSLDDLVKIETDFDAVLGAGGGTKQEAAKVSAGADDKMQQEAEAELRREAEAEVKRDEEERRRKDEQAQERQRAEDQAREEPATREQEHAEAQARLDAQNEETERHFAEMEKELEAEQVTAKDEKKPPESPQDARKRDKEEARARARAEAAVHAEAPVRAYEAGAAAEETRVAYRAPINWGKPVALALFLILILGLALVHVVSFDGYIPQFEKLASAHLRQPVKIKALHLSLVPLPHWRLDGVSVGKEGQLEVARINAVAELGSMFSDKKVFKSIELESPVLSEEGLFALLFGKPQGQDLKVASIIVKNGKLNSKIMILPALDAKIAIGEDGAWQKIALETADHKTSLLLEPKGDVAQLEVETNAFSMPFGPAFILENFSAKGVLGRDELRLSEFKGGIYGGYLSGNASLKWGAGWSLGGEISVRAMDPGRIAPALLEEGKLEAKAVYAMRAKSYDELFAAPRMEGTFAVQKGSLLGVDLVRLLQGGSVGGRTAFAELSGNFVADGGKTQLRQVHLGAGPVSAGGNADADAGKNISGRFAVELKSPVAQARANLAVSGTLREPRFNR